MANSKSRVKLLSGSALVETAEAADAWWNDLDFERALFDSKSLRTEVTTALTKANIERTFDGAPTVKLDVFDKKLELLNGALKFDEGTELDIDGVKFGLAKVQKTGSMISLTFEDMVVVVMRRYVKALKANRKTITRAEFIFKMLKEIRELDFDFYCPDLRKAQPVEHGKKAKAAQKGLTGKKGLKIKGQAASSEQLRTCDAVLDACVDLKVSERGMIGAIACIIQELNATNRAGGDPGTDSTGAFQQRADTGWRGDLRNIPNQVKNFWKDAPTTPFSKVLKQYPDKSLGWQISQTQRDYTFNTGGQGKDYNKWVDEAKKIVEAYGGSSAPAADGRYQFQRGTGGKKEDTWTAARRLGEEVGRRFFVDLNTVFYVDDGDLRSALESAEITYPQEGVTFDFDFDFGKVAQTGTLNAVAPPFTLAPGRSAKVERHGPGNGLWIVQKISKDLRVKVPAQSIEATRPAPVRKEPAASANAATKSSSSDSESGYSDAITAIRDRARKLDGQRRSYDYGGGHGLSRAALLSSGAAVELDCSSSVSYVLGMAPRVSGDFASWGKPGDGGKNTVTVYYNPTHVFMWIPGLGFFGTSGSNPGGGPGFIPASQMTAAYKARFQRRHL